MTVLDGLSKRELIQLSAYLDGELSEREVRQLESRLKKDPELQRALEELNATSRLLAALPAVRPTRNFTLSPEMAGVRRGWSLYPVFRLATVVATVAFAVLVGADALLSQSLMRAMAPGADSRELAEAPLEQAPEEALGQEFAPLEKVEEEEEALQEPLPTVVLETEQEAPAAVVEEAPTSCPECTPAPEKESMGMREDEGDRASPTAAPAFTPTPAPSPEPVREVAEPTPFPPIRFVEIGLGLLAIILASLTFYTRQSR
jgi:hypothetical protein